jgi:hypothetical protein
MSEPAIASSGQWMGAYLNQSKIGWSYLSISPPDQPSQITKQDLKYMGKAPETPYRSLLGESQMGIMAYGNRKTVYWKTLAFLNQDYSLYSFLFRMVSDDSKSEFKGTIEGHDLVFTLTSSGDTRTEKFALGDSKVYLPEAVVGLLIQSVVDKQPLEGSFQVVEPHQITISTWKVAFEGTEKLAFGNQELETYRFRQDAKGLSTLTWITPEGTVVKEWAAIGENVGYLSLNETREQAESGDFIHPAVGLQAQAPTTKAAEPDLLYATSVPAGKDIHHPSLVRRMVIDLSNFSLDKPVPGSAFQKIISASKTEADKTQIRLEITCATLPPPPLPPAPKEYPGEFQRYLQPEPLLQADHPEIIKQAAAIVGDNTHSWEKALKIQEWMAANIQSEFRITLPSALEVLQTGKGDCNEQSALFAALARAAGIPVRICTGLVYQRSAFYYHAWNEVLVSHQPVFWMPIDPVLKQSRVDATHIKFGEGGLSEQSYITNLIGKIRAQIVELEMESAPPPNPPQ